MAEIAATEEIGISLQKLTEKMKGFNGNVKEVRNSLKEASIEVDNLIEKLNFLKQQSCTVTRKDLDDLKAEFKTYCRRNFVYMSAEEDD